MAMRMRLLFGLLIQHHDMIPALKKDILLPRPYLTFGRTSTAGALVSTLIMSRANDQAGEPTRMRNRPSYLCSAWMTVTYCLNSWNHERYISSMGKLVLSPWITVILGILLEQATIQLQHRENRSHLSPHRRPNH